MKKKFTSISINTSEQSQKPTYKKTILDQIVTSKNDVISTNFEDEILQRHTFLLKEEIIEKIKDFVYTQKITGNIMFTQKDLLEQALNSFFVGKQIQKRPPDFIEKRGRKR